MSTGVEVARQVEARAQSRCEYCRMHQTLQGATFHVEHIVPRAQGGSSDMHNLAWACPRCNFSKSDRTQGSDPESGAMVSLFNPRTDEWGEHFQLDGYQIVGRTTIGRATVAVLDLNYSRRILIRHAEELFGLFPP